MPPLAWTLLITRTPLTLLTRTTRTIRALLLTRTTRAPLNGTTRALLNGTTRALLTRTTGPVAWLAGWTQRLGTGQTRSGAQDACRQPAHNSCAGKQFRALVHRFTFSISAADLNRLSQSTIRHGTMAHI